MDTTRVMVISWEQEQDNKGKGTTKIEARNRNLKELSMRGRMIENILKELDSINEKVNTLQIDTTAKSEIQGYLRRINGILLKSIFP